MPRQKKQIAVGSGAICGVSIPGQLTATTLTSLKSGTSPAKSGCEWASCDIGSCHAMLDKRENLVLVESHGMAFDKFMRTIIPKFRKTR
jgi:hypothetical protein